MNLIKRANNICGIIIASFSLFFYFYMVQGLSNNHEVSNIVLYIGGMVVFIGVYFFCELFLSRLSISDVCERLLAVFIALLSVIWLIRAFYEEIRPEVNFTHGYLRHSMPSIIYAIILILAVSFCIGVSSINYDRGGAK